MTKKVRVCKNFTYYSIIKEAILSEKGKKATSSQIFAYITNKHPLLFRESNSMTWKGNIRQLLSKNPEFVKLQKDEISKLHYWKFVPLEEIIENEKDSFYSNANPMVNEECGQYSNYYDTRSYKYQFHAPVFNYQNSFYNQQNTIYDQMCYYQDEHINNNFVYNKKYDTPPSYYHRDVSIHEFRDIENKKRMFNKELKRFNCSEVFEDIKSNNKIFKNEEKIYKEQDCRSRIYKEQDSASRIYKELDGAAKIFDNNKTQLEELYNSLNKVKNDTDFVYLTKEDLIVEDQEENKQIISNISDFLNSDNSIQNIEADKIQVDLEEDLNKINERDLNIEHNGRKNINGDLKSNIKQENINEDLKINIENNKEDLKDKINKDIDDETNQIEKENQNDKNVNRNTKNTNTIDKIYDKDLNDKIENLKETNRIIENTNTIDKIYDKDLNDKIENIKDTNTIIENTNIIDKINDENIREIDINDRNSKLNNKHTKDRYIPKGVKETKLKPNNKVRNLRRSQKNKSLNSQP
ncbi:forkhead-box domain-containing protein [Vairimorpha necatrix]|uniref:Forkhead-box domain-containing protein n=1 Tax=Vairimorpha necatrix TaxID=6039 RepID=A0AAX4JE40_9MICR